MNTQQAIVNSLNVADIQFFVRKHEAAKRMCDKSSGKDKLHYVKARDTFKAALKLINARLAKEPLL